MRLTLYFSASVLKTPPSSSRISRRTTLSRVVVLPTKLTRLTKYCSPSCIRIVTSTIGEPSAVFTGPAGFSSAGAFGSTLVAGLQIGKAGELPVADLAVHLAGRLEALADALLAVELPFVQLEQRAEAFALDDLVALEVEVADLVAPALLHRGCAAARTGSCRRPSLPGTSARARRRAPRCSRGCGSTR